MLGQARLLNDPLFSDALGHPSRAQLKMRASSSRAPLPAVEHRCVLACVSRRCCESRACHGIVLVMGGVTMDHVIHVHTPGFAAGVYVFLQGRGAGHDACARAGWTTPRSSAPPVL